MEIEQDNSHIPLEQFNDNQLAQLIISTFRGRTQAQVKQAEQLIVRALNTPGMLQRFVRLLTSPTEPQVNFKKAIALIIKKYSFQCSRLAGDKSHLIENIYSLLMNDDLQFTAKDVLGTALQHLISSEDCLYRQTIFKNVITVLNSDQGLHKFDGCIIALNAHFNTLSRQEDILDFFFYIEQPAIVNALLILKQILSTPFETWLTCDKPIMVKLSKFFTFFETVMEEIFSIVDQYPEEAKNIRESSFLLEMLEKYLLLFNHNFSIISREYNPINEIKRIIMNIIVTIYMTETCPLNLFKIIFVTFLTESDKIVNDFEVEAILIKCIEVLDESLERKEYLEYFSQKQIEILFALFLYSVTNLEEYQLIDEGPEKFVQIAEDYTETNSRSDYLKVRAGTMLLIFIEKVDEALKTTVDVLIMMSSQIFVPESKEVVPQIQQTFGKYMFYKLSDELKIEASFMILSTLSRKINRRADLLKLVNSFFQSHFNTIIAIESHLVILRIMRAVSYFPSAIFFLYLETQMSTGKVFILEGIKSFERILKSNKYPELLDLLVKIIASIMGVIRISDPIMELIVINYYDSMLKKSHQLYHRCRQKIKQEFYICKDTNHHSALICFNLIYSLLKKQKDEEDRKQILDIFYDFAEHLIQKQNSEAYRKYEEKLFQIFDLVLDIRSFSSEQIQSFIQNSMHFLARYEKGSIVFKMYNNYICKMEGAVFKLQNCFKMFWEEVKERINTYTQEEDTLAPVSYYCLLMSQIIANNMQANLSNSELDELLVFVNKVPACYKQYPLLVFLSLAYEMPQFAVRYLIEKGIYQNFLEEVTKVQFEGKLPKKIIILALIRLIEVQEQFETFKIIMEYCIAYLKLQYRKSRRILTKITAYETKPRRLGQQRLVQNSIQEQEDDNEMVNIFVNFKHPYRSLSEYQNFKVILTHRHGFLNQLGEPLLKDIKQILQTEWVDNKTRIIRRVVK